jgi:hypothetical protein
MRSNRPPVIRITAVDDKPNQFVASFRSEFLGATYAVVFSATITGAIALHRFALMISGQYGKQVEIQIAEDLFPVKNKAVEDILNSIGKPEPVHR